MARPMTFDKEQALDQVMSLFWDNGFEATSIRDLTGALGITSTSLYNAFGDKRQLFLQALERYLQLRQARFLAELELEPSPRRAIERMFEAAIKPCIEQADRRGCFLANSALERAPHDPEVAAIVRRGFAEAEAFLARKLAAAQKAGEVTAKDDPELLARGMLVAFLGLRSLVRAGAGRKELEAALQGALCRLG